LQSQTWRSGVEGAGVPVVGDTDVTVVVGPLDAVLGDDELHAASATTTAATTTTRMRTGQ
jgi:hypothetical protein